MAVQLEQREFELAGVEQELANVTAEASAERGMLEDELQEAQAVAEDWQQRVAELEGRFGELQQELAESRARSANSRETMLEHETRKLRWVGCPARRYPTGLAGCTHTCLGVTHNIYFGCVKITNIPNNTEKYPEITDNEKFAQASRGFCVSVVHTVRNFQIDVAPPPSRGRGETAMATGPKAWSRYTMRFSLPRLAESCPCLFRQGGGEAEGRAAGGVACGHGVMVAGAGGPPAGRPGANNMMDNTAAAWGGRSVLARGLTVSTPWLLCRVVLIIYCFYVCLRLGDMSTPN